MSTNQLNLGRR